jgi:hypothetical protein
MKEKLGIVQRVEYLKSVCKGKSVLHLGCTNFPYTDHSLEHNSLLHLELLEIANDLSGLDFDQRGLDILAKRGIRNLYRGDLEKLDEVDLNETFDVIIAGEMIEHLSNPGLFLGGIQRFMNSETKLVITTINAYCGLRYAIYALRGKGGFNEPVHKDHVSYYSYSTLKLIVERSGLQVSDFQFYDIGPEHRVHNPWYWNLANDFAVLLGPQLSDGVIVECRLNN